MSRRIQIHSARAMADSSVRSGIGVEYGLERRSSPVGATSPRNRSHERPSNMPPLRGLRDRMGVRSTNMTLLTELRLDRLGERGRGTT